MAKYSSLYKDVYSIFAQAAWKSENIKTFPENFVGSSDKYIRVNIVSGSDSVNKLSVSGQLIVDIFTPAGEGTIAATEIADKLDVYLCNKTFSTGHSGNTQMFASTLVSLGKDTVNTNLFRFKYSIPFNFFGI